MFGLISFFETEMIKKNLISFSRASDLVTAMLNIALDHDKNMKSIMKDGRGKKTGNKNRAHYFITYYNPNRLRAGSERKLKQLNYRVKLNNVKFLNALDLDSNLGKITLDYQPIFFKYVSRSRNKCGKKDMKEAPSSDDVIAK